MCKTAPLRPRRKRELRFRGAEPRSTRVSPPLLTQGRLMNGWMRNLRSAKLGMLKLGMFEVSSGFHVQVSETRSVVRQHSSAGLHTLAMDGAFTYPRPTAGLCSSGTAVFAIRKLCCVSSPSYTATWPRPRTTSSDGGGVRSALIHRLHSAKTLGMRSISGYPERGESAKLPHSRPTGQLHTTKPLLHCKSQSGPQPRRALNPLRTNR